MGARVRVAWPADDEYPGQGTAYDGCVVSVCMRGSAVRVEFDELVGNGQYGARRCHTVEVHELARL